MWDVASSRWDAIAHDQAIVASIWDAETSSGLLQVLCRLLCALCEMLQPLCGLLCRICLSGRKSWIGRDDNTTLGQVSLLSIEACDSSVMT